MKLTYLKRFILPKHNKDVYRYGGDEFLILSRSRDLTGFCDKLDKLNEKFAKTCIGDVKTSFSCSFGSVSGYPDTSLEFFDLIMKADKKLYEAKSIYKSEKT